MRKRHFAIPLAAALLLASAGVHADPFKHESGHRLHRHGVTYVVHHHHHRHAHKGHRDCERERAKRRAELRRERERRYRETRRAYRGGEIRRVERVIVRHPAYVPRPTARIHIDLPL